MHSGYPQQSHHPISFPAPVTGKTAPLQAPSAAELRAPFEQGRPTTFGAEEEAMVLDPASLDLAPRAAELCDGETLKLELPASQLEIAGAPAASLAELGREIRAGRRRAARAASGRVLLASAGVHPFASAAGALNGGERYERLANRYGAVAQHQLVCALHVHVALEGADRALAVYNAMRSYLPLLAALAADAPVHLGRDTGLASVRPLISAMLPRQGVPPALSGWDQLAGGLDWLGRSGRISALGEWWWELRLHPLFGTIEIRVADAQPRAADAEAIAAFAAGLVLWLSARHDGGDLPAPAPSWQIAENRFSAARHGLAGEMIDLESGAAFATAEHANRLLAQIEPYAIEHDGAEALARARELLAGGGGAAILRNVFLAGGAEALARHLADCLSDGCEDVPGAPC